MVAELAHKEGGEEEAFCNTLFATEKQHRCDDAKPSCGVKPSHFAGSHRRGLQLDVSMVHDAVGWTPRVLLPRAKL